MFFLVRHADHDEIAVRLAGRAPGVVLSQAGKAQARRLGEQLRAARLDRICASPRERAIETAIAIEEACGVGPIEISDALDEVDFGPWSGQDFADLARDPQWRRWNECRSFSRPPNGESVLEIQTRIIGFLAKVSAALPEGAVAVVSHAEVIRATLLYCLGLPPDAWALLEIAPASISRLSMTALGAKVVSFNETFPAPGGMEHRA